MSSLFKEIKCVELCETFSKILCILVMLTISLPGTAQNGIFLRLANMYESEVLNDTTYMNLVKSCADSLLSQGILIGNEELRKNLKLYRKIAWERGGIENKQAYFGILANQAQMADRGGEMLYYAEQLEKLQEQHNKRPSIAALTIIADFYRSHRKFNKVKQIYQSGIKSYLLNTPLLLARDSIDASQAVQTMIYLDKSLEAIVQLQDTVVSREIYDLMDRTAEVIMKKYRAGSLYDIYARYCLTRSLLNKSIAEHNVKTRLLALRRLDSLRHVSQSTGALQAYIYQAFVENKIKYYIDASNADSLSYWIDIFNKNHHPPATDYESQYYLKSWYARMFFLKGDYIKSNASMQEAIDLIEKFKVQNMIDIDGILYAHAEAEEIGFALTQAKTKIKIQVLWILGLISFLIIVVLSMLIYSRIMRRKLSAKISALNNSVQLQIHSLEESRLITAYEEQQRISRELHDAWSPELVSALHQIQFMIQDTNEADTKSGLHILHNHIKGTYSALRIFCHQLHDYKHEMDDELFEKRIRSIINQVLPDKRYTKYILIANGTMQHITLKQRIELLRIIQESIVNIVKHASAKKVNILLYEEDGLVTLNITDDGHGFDAETTMNGRINKGLGLNSMRERAAALNGVFDITSGEGGTNINVQFSVT